MRQVTAPRALFGDLYFDDGTTEPSVAEAEFAVNTIAGLFKGV
jgi:hypothetical protein